MNWFEAAKEIYGEHTDEEIRAIYERVRAAAQGQWPGAQTWPDFDDLPAHVIERMRMLPPDANASDIEFSLDRPPWVEAAGEAEWTA
jgi:hypothetical protein